MRSAVVGAASTVAPACSPEAPERRTAGCGSRGRKLRAGTRASGMGCRGGPLSERTATAGSPSGAFQAAAIWRGGG